MVQVPCIRAQTAGNMRIFARRVNTVRYRTRPSIDRYASEESWGRGKEISYMCGWLLEYISGKKKGIFLDYVARHVLIPIDGSMSINKEE